MQIWKEFKTFAMRGNVIDLAVGVLGGVNVRQLAITLSTGGESGEPVLLRYGLFFQSIIDFLIIAGAVFFVVQAMNRLQRKADSEEQESPAEPAPPSREEQLLTEIRDAIRESH